MIKSYRADRDVFRQGCLARINSEFPDKQKIDTYVEEYFKEIFNYFEVQGFDQIANAKYIAPLMVSFLRTYYVVLDHIEYAEIIEASTLARKQFELLARLQEILDPNSVIGKLDKKTPNVSNLKSKVKTLYGSYSEIAHSSTFQPLDLLGRVDSEDRSLYAIYPSYHPNVLVCYSNNFMTFLEFYILAQKFLKSSSVQIAIAFDDTRLGEMVERLISNGLLSRAKI